MRICLISTSHPSDISQRGIAEEPAFAQTSFGEILFVGRVYNQEELCTEFGIDKGSDTGQFLLSAWRKKGESIVERLNGEFAIIVMDYDSGNIWAGRDIFGFIPLYYRKGKSGPEFSFSPGSLAGGSGIDSLDKGHIAQYLSGHLLSQSSSEFRGVSRVEAGEVICWKDGVERKSRIWKNPIQLECNYQEACERIRDGLNRSLARRFADRGKLGLSLSGGQDSACLYSTTARDFSEQAGNFQFYTLSFPGFECDETERVKVLSQAFSGLSEPLILIAQLSGAEFLKRELELHSGLPNYPTGLLVSQLKERLREDGSATLVAGYGSDELFTISGVGEGKGAKLSRLISPLLPGFLKSGLRKAGLAPQWIPTWFTAKFVRDTGIRDFLQQALHNPYPASSKFRNKYFNLFDPSAIRMRELEWRDARSRGVELVCPYLDKEFVEICFSLPADYFDGQPGRSSYLLEKPLAFDSLGAGLPEVYRTNPSRVDFSPVARKIFHNVIVGKLPFSGPLADMGWVEPDDYSRSLSEVIEEGKIDGPSFWELWSTWACNEYLKKF